MPRAHEDWEAAFWAKVREAAPGDLSENGWAGCWLWTCSLNKGYGQFGTRSAGCRRGLTVISSRIAYELVVAVIPPGLVIDHLCRRPACVNPAHLEVVTVGENVRRGREATKAMCGRGHLLTGRNVTNGRRFCEVCAKVNRAAWLARRAVAA